MTIDNRTGGQWTEQESHDHINVLELRAALFALLALCKGIQNQHILIKIDNKTAICYINEMGGTKSFECNKVAREIWIWCIENRNWLTATYIEGKLNTEADQESRNFKPELEWKLDENVFADVLNIFGKNYDIDLFASRINKKFKKFISWRPDPLAYHIDAFTINWENLKFYAFPPFSLINRMLQKVKTDMAEGIVIVPKWPTAGWFPVLLSMLIDNPLVLPGMKHLLTLPQLPEMVHPLHPKMTLLACKISASTKRQRDYRKTLETLYSIPGEIPPRNNITTTLRNGRCSVIQDRLIQYHHL